MDNDTRTFFGRAGVTRTSFSAEKTAFSAETTGRPVMKGRASKNKLSWFCCHTHACQRPGKSLSSASVNRVETPFNTSLLTTPILILAYEHAAPGSAQFAYGFPRDPLINHFVRKCDCVTQSITYSTNNFAC